MGSCLHERSELRLVLTGRSSAESLVYVCVCFRYCGENSSDLTMTVVSCQQILGGQGRLTAAFGLRLLEEPGGLNKILVNKLEDRIPHSAQQLAEFEQVGGWVCGCDDPRRVYSPRGTASPRRRVAQYHKGHRIAHAPGRFSKATFSTATGAPRPTGASWEVSDLPRSFHFSILFQRRRFPRHGATEP